MDYTRRKFIKKTSIGAVGIAALSSKIMVGKNILGANDRIICAIAGIRSRGKAHAIAINQQKNSKILYSCDVDDNILNDHNKWSEKNIGYVPKVEKDYRKLIEDKNIDAVFIATPEHWHAPMAIMAMEAGKHVYVEKPCSHNLYENELLVKAQIKYGVKVQMGNQQRSSITSSMAINDIKKGVIGNVFKGEAYYSNNRGSIGIGKVVAIPDTLDWELWQGPAPRRKYKDNIHPYNWHWFRDWGTGEVHNNGTHEIDICRWALGVDYPETVTSFGGKYAYEDDWEFVDNQQVTFKYSDNKFITWTGHSRGLIQPNQPGRGVTIYGSKGTIQLDRNFYKLYDLGGDLIKNELEIVSNKDSKNNYYVKLNTIYSKEIKSKNNSGIASNYEVTVEASFDIDSEIITFEEKFIVKNISDSIEQKNYEDIIKKNFAASIREKLMTKLLSLQ